MKKFVILLILIFVAATQSSARYIEIADSLTESAVYPGTVHTFTVTIPDAYDGSTPAALFLALDGITCNAPAVIDSLSTAGVMPVTIGVYLQPGIIRDSDGRVIRYNRSNEFDATDRRFADFLDTELLPAVSRMSAPDGRPVRLTDNPSDRMIYGLSSGGIAAFVAAWHRPDLFGKIYSGCGTFVHMRGGNSLQAIVRKHEPLSLRIYLQDGYTDSWNPLFGSWYEANRILASALGFAGYDSAFDWAPGGHSIRRTTQILPDVLKWMWRDGSAPVVPGNTANNLLAPILNGSGQWKPCAASGVSLSGRREAVYPDSTLVAAAAPGTNYLTQYILGKDGERRYGQPFYWLHTYDNSALGIYDMAFDGNGNLWVLTSAGIQICDQNGRVRGILALPCRLGDDAALSLRDGHIILVSSGRAYIRRLNVTPAVPGQTPPSQGQA